MDKDVVITGTDKGLEYTGETVDSWLCMPGFTTIDFGE